MAGVDSCKDLDQAGVEDVMAVIEDLGFSGDESPTYWRDKVRGRGTRSTARMVRLIRQLVVDSRYPLEALVLRFSADRTDRVEQLTPREAWQLIEMLRAAGRRESQPATPRRKKTPPRTAEPAAHGGDVYGEEPF